MAGPGPQTSILEQRLTAVFQVVHELSQHMAQLSANSVQAEATAYPPRNCQHMPFAGDLNQYRVFVFKCPMTFAQ